MKSEAEVLAEYRSKATSRLAQAASNITTSLAIKAQIQKHPKKSLAVGGACVFVMALAVRKASMVTMGRKAMVATFGVAGRMLLRRVLLHTSTPPSEDVQTLADEKLT